MTDQKSANPTSSPPVPGWRARYVQGSFRGVLFTSAAREASGGRRNGFFELPFRDRPIAEDMGRRARESAIDCFVAGSDYMDRRDALIGALEKYGPGTLIDPWTGAQAQVIVEDYRLSESSEEGGIARFSILFRESGAEAPMAARADTAAQARGSAKAMAQAAPQDFAARFSVDKAAGFVEDAANALVSGAALAAELAAATTGGIGPALRSFESGLRLLPASAASLLRSPLHLGQAIVGLIGAVEALAPAGSRRIAALTGLAGFGTMLRPVAATTPQRVRQADNQAAFVHLVRIAADAALVTTAADMIFPSQSEAAGLRDQLARLFDGHALEAADAGEDARAAQFDALRDVMVRDIGARSAPLARGYRYTPRSTQPALVIAQRLHGFGAGLERQAMALVAANHVRHPGFVPGGAALTVAVQAAGGTAAGHG